MGQRMKDLKLGIRFSTKPGFAKGKRLNYKHIKIGRRDEQISTTQTCHRRGLGAEPPAAGGYESLGARHPAAGQFFVSFWKKMAILMPFGSHFARFQRHLKHQIFEIRKPIEQIPPFA